MTETKPAAKATEPEFYPASQGGHRKGWGMGPCYRIKESQMPGRKGGCEKKGKKS
jgi:hypothetical protein